MRMHGVVGPAFGRDLCNEMIDFLLEGNEHCVVPGSQLFHDASVRQKGLIQFAASIVAEEKGLHQHELDVAFLFHLRK